MSDQGSDLEARYSRLQALYRVGIDGGREVVAHAVSGPARHWVRLVVGDRVTIELSPRDDGRGRIVGEV